MVNEIKKLDTGMSSSEVDSIADEFAEIEKEGVDVKDEPELKPESFGADDSKENELSADDFNSISYLKNPEVGESIEFTVNKIIQNPKIGPFKNKTDGSEFYVGCKKKDGTYVRLDVHTSDNEVFTLNSWGLFFLFRGKKSLFSEKVRENGKIAGIKVKITRHYSGNVPKKTAKEVMKLYDLNTVDEAIAYQKEVAKAVKEGRLYTMEILN